MRRREFVRGLAAATAGWPLAVRAQQSKTVKKVAFVAGGNADLIPSLFSGFVQGMQDLGYVEGKDFIMEWRFAEWNYARYSAFGVELAQKGVDTIVLANSAAVRPMMEATSTVPIIMGYCTDPVGNHFIESLAHPGGNVTGLASSTDDTAPKQLELLATFVPRMSRIGVLMNPNNPSAVSLKIVERAAHLLSIAVVPVEALDASQFEAAFSRFVRERVDALLVLADAVFFGQRAQIADRAIGSRLPTIFANREYVSAGGLMSYGEDLRTFLRRAATYVDKIFKGARPADLPVEQPTRFNLVINLKTAKALDLSVPPMLLALADEVIE